MATERYFVIRCDLCGDACEANDPKEISEREVRRDLKKRLGWTSYTTSADSKREWRDICPNCRAK